MKKIAILSFSACLFFACNNTNNPAEAETSEQDLSATADYQYYGDSISDEGAVSTDELLALLEKNDSVPVKVRGTILSSCKMKGCWMKMDLADGKEMHITFKDYGFFVPKNLDGEMAIVEGYATVDTLDVLYLRHLAEDAGKSKDEIDAITEPKITIAYEATGVIIKP